MTVSRSPLDPVVKLGLGVLVGSFLLVGIGMFLSRPDRSIPFYSIGSQKESVVAVHIPPSTSDHRLQSLIQRFRTIGRDTRDFGPLKIQSTTPTLPGNHYQRMTMYIFGHPKWTTEEMLEKYLRLSHRRKQDEQEWIKEFELAVRGGYILKENGQSGWIGPILPKNKAQGFSRVQELFHDTFSKHDSEQE